MLWQGVCTALLPVLPMRRALCSDDRAARCRGCQKQKGCCVMDVESPQSGILQLQDTLLAGLIDAACCISTVRSESSLCSCHPSCCTSSGACGVPMHYQGQAPFAHVLLQDLSPCRCIILASIAFLTSSSKHAVHGDHRSPRKGIAVAALVRSHCLTKIACKSNSCLTCIATHRHQA